MKLLAKTAEERYQTAAGLEPTFGAAWPSGSAAAASTPFPLGEHDMPDRLLIPEKLYGREREIDDPARRLRRVVASGTPELVLVSGYSGIGKSSVVNELHKVLVPPRGLFASGKFDQYKRDIPYATLAQAFQSLVRQLLGKSDAELASWRDALREALGPNGQLIVDLIPELELIIGEQPPVPELPPQDAQSRFQLVFRRFLGVFARPEHPLALFLDDLQWLDAATLDLLEHLLTQPEVRHLLLIGAYRDNEVGAAHPLMRMLEAIREAGAQVQEIVLAPLPRDDRRRSWSPSAALRAASTPRRWRSWCIEKTGGNPFFAIQFLHGARRGGLARLRSGDGALDLGPRAHPRQGLHRQRRGPHGRQAERLPADDAGGAAAAGLPRQRAPRSTTLALVLGTSEEADPRGSLGGRPRRSSSIARTAPTGSSTTACRRPPIR